jgi:hypothetical protein
VGPVCVQLLTLSSWQQSWQLDVVWVHSLRQTEAVQKVYRIIEITLHVIAGSSCPPQCLAHRRGVIIEDFNLEVASRSPAAPNFRIKASLTC